MRHIRIIVCLLSLFLVACEGTTFQSSVPAYPVRVVIDTKQGAFVHFQPTVTGSYITIDGDGYYMNGSFVLPLGATDMYGYGGIVVYVDLFGYSAYDMACPYCAGRGQCRPCTIDGIYATCPECGEKYDLASGSAVPQNGLSHESLRRMNLINSDGKLTITQR